MHNNSLQAGFLNSLMSAGANLELNYGDLAPHAAERMAAALALAKHAREIERQLKFNGISASTVGLKALAEAGGGFVTFGLVN
ncbi:hypothetical protein RQP53_10850 [Paucibacter sp. APW11]|uniref:Uncharacterized protein n=1 Tax=Roseateles aquae TaxID=3077235 RepID=A0ABU3PB31_9BURK|nr:hypothetical protein [Paucibacter sp. APW11]MDT8999766.1 hypothetical protein [Paucibacter sp. APW11]